MSRIDAQLGSHRAALLACRRCAHGDGVQPIVSLARSPRVMLVGQAPGQTEAGGGKPFAGRAGRTLFSWLARAGIDEASARERIYIAAVTRCYPGPSPSGRGDRVPGPRERDACAGWLRAELEIIQPVLLVPVGRLAIDALIGAVQLDQVVGRELALESHSRWALRRSPAVVPLPHPSGASSWVHLPANAALLERALRHIARHWQALSRSRKVA